MAQIKYVIFKFLILLDVCWETKNVNLNFQRSDSSCLKSVLFYYNDSKSILSFHLLQFFKKLLCLSSKFGVDKTVSCLKTIWLINITYQQNTQPFRI